MSDGGSLKTISRPKDASGFVRLTCERPEGGDFLTEHQLFCLPELPGLRGLNLRYVRFDVAGIRNFPQSETLDLSNTEVGDECVPTLRALTRLRRLCLAGTAITRTGNGDLRRGIPDYEITW
jgi:hypothetical protein